MTAKKTFSVNVASDFDALAKLAKRDPDAFEAIRDRLIREFIAAAPPSKREYLERIQWRVERERERASSPTGACVAISRMMWDSLLNLRDEQESLVDHWRDRSQQDKPRARATVIAFPARNPR